MSDLTKNKIKRNYDNIGLFLLKTKSIKSDVFVCYYELGYYHVSYLYDMKKIEKIKIEDVKTMKNLKLSTLSEEKLKIIANFSKANEVIFQKYYNDLEDSDKYILNDYIQEVGFKIKIKDRIEIINNFLFIDDNIFNIDEILMISFNKNEDKIIIYFNDKNYFLYNISKNNFAFIELKILNKLIYFESMVEKYYINNKRIKSINFISDNIEIKYKDIREISKHYITKEKYDEFIEIFKIKLREKQNIKYKKNIENEEDEIIEIY